VEILGQLVDIWFIIKAQVLMGGVLGLVILYWVYIRKAVKMKIMANSGGWRIVKELDAPLKASEKKWNKETYFIDLKMAFLDKRQNPILFYELHKFEPLNLSISGSIFDAKALQNILDNHDLADLKHGEKEKLLLYIIVGCVVVIGVVAGVGFYFNSQQTGAILELSRRFAGTIANMTKSTVIIP
jgi:hypothetical protein